MCVSLCLRLRLPGYDDQCADLSWWAHRGIWSRPRHSDSPLQTTPTGKRDLHQPYRCSPRWHKENHKPNIVNLSFIICHTLYMSLCPCGCFGFFFFSLHLCLDSRTAPPGKVGQQHKAAGVLRSSGGRVHWDHWGWSHDQGFGHLHQRPFKVSVLLSRQWFHFWICLCQVIDR